MPEPVLISRKERVLIDVARERSRVIGESIASFSTPESTLPHRLIEAAALAEPDANCEAVDGTLERLVSLPETQQRRRAGLLTAIVAEVRGLESKRLIDLATAGRGRADLAPFATLLLIWSEQIAETGEDLVQAA